VGNVEPAAAATSLEGRLLPPAAHRAHAKRVLLLLDLDVRLDALLVGALLVDLLGAVASGVSSERTATAAAAALALAAMQMQCNPNTLTRPWPSFQPMVASILKPKEALFTP
jgi:hypothetical protein